MADRISTEARSQLMRSVRAKSTGPERVVRSVLHRLGYRFAYRTDHLPGRPDIVLPKYRTAVFVHGCFWHQHVGCSKSKRPQTRTWFWNKKLDENIARDRRVESELAQDGWRVIVVWECKTRDLQDLERNLRTAMKRGAP